MVFCRLLFEQHQLEHQVTDHSVVEAVDVVAVDQEVYYLHLASLRRIDLVILVVNKGAKVALALAEADLLFYCLVCVLSFPAALVASDHAHVEHA